MVVDSVIRNVRIISQDGGPIEKAGIAVDEGKIVTIGHVEELPPATQELDMNNDILVPGIIDCHVHTRSPGQEYREDWESVTRAAAAGGVTTIIAMPNTDPVIDRSERLETVYSLIRDHAIVDAQSYGLLTADNIHHLRGLVEAGAVGFKCFLVESGQYSFGTPNDGKLHEAMIEIEELESRVGFHEENNDIVAHYIQKYKNENQNHPTDQPKSRPVIAEVEAVSRICRLADSTGCPVHMFHVSSGSAAAVIAEAQARGTEVSAETMPHYLQFDETILDEAGNAARVNPPFRSAEEREQLWDVGIHDGTIECIASDHAPYTDEEKGADDFFQNTWNVMSGFVGLETEVAAMLTLVNEGRLSLEKWVEMHSRNPARTWGIYPQKGSLNIGTDADFTIINPDEHWTVDRTQFHSKSKVSPYDGKELRGNVSATVVRGELVYADGELLAEPGFGEVVGLNN